MGKQDRSTCMREYYSVSKSKEIMICATKWMKLEYALLSAISQSPKDKCCVIAVINMRCLE